MNIEVRLFKGVDEINKIRRVYQNMQYHPNSDFDHFLLVCQIRANVIAPLVLSVWDKEQCLGILAGRIESVSMRPSIGYARMPGFSAKVLTFINEGMLGVFSHEMWQAAFEALNSMMEDHQVDTIHFHMMKENSHEFWETLKQHGLRTSGAQPPVWSIHRDFSMEKEPGFLLRNMKSKHRSWIKRKERELAKEHGESIVWTWHTTVDNIPALCALIEQVARTTYQRGLGVGFFDDEETRQRLALFAGRGELRVLLLEVEDKPKAFWLGTVYGDTFFSDATGYTADVMAFEVGTQTFIRLVDELVKEGVDRFDFGLGEAHYKKRFADRFWRETSVQIFAPTTKGGLLWHYLQGIGRVDAAARRIVKRMGIFDRVKQAWRGRLRK